MAGYFRYGGQVEPRIPTSAPLSYRLPEEVYALDGLGDDYMVAPSARLSIGPDGKLYESMGDITTDPIIQVLGSPMAMIAGGLAAAYHGYKRSDSAGVALVWGALGAFSPVITNAVAVYQGYGKKQKKG